MLEELDWMLHDGPVDREGWYFSSASDHFEPANRWAENEHLVDITESKVSLSSRFRSLGFGLGVEGSKQFLWRPGVAIDDNPFTIAPYLHLNSSWPTPGVVIDFDTKRLFWAEVKKDGAPWYLPRIVNRFIELSWPGWTAIWAAEGLRGPLAAAGLDTSKLFTKEIDHNGSWGAYTMMLPWEEDKGENRPGDDCFSAVLPDGRFVQWGAEYFSDEVSYIGPETIRSYVEEIYDRASRGDQLWFDQNKDPGHATSGVHIDFKNRLLRWWSVLEDERGLPSFAEYWDGWRIECMGDNFEWQEEIVQREICNWDERAWMALEVARDVGQELPHDYGLAWVANDYTRISEKVASNLSKSVKRLEKKSNFIQENIRKLEVECLREQFPPAIFIDRHGIVHNEASWRQFFLCAES